jgi:hypothetical protein
MTVFMFVSSPLKILEDQVQRLNDLLAYKRSTSVLCLYLCNASQWCCFQNEYFLRLVLHANKHSMLIANANRGFLNVWNLVSGASHLVLRRTNPLLGEERSPSSISPPSVAPALNITVKIRSCIYRHAKYCEASHRPKTKHGRQLCWLGESGGEVKELQPQGVNARALSPPSLIFGNSSDRVLVLPAGGGSPTTRRPSGLCLFCPWLSHLLFSLLKQSYEHSGEIELARLNSNCVKSFVLYASYELGDCSDIDLRERKNRRPVSHRPRQSGESVGGQ